MKLNSITKKYGGRTVFSDFTLEIEESKITAVLGESGAGKTTLLNIIAGLTEYQGTTEGVGQCSYLFQTPRLLPNLTVEGNLRFVLPDEVCGKIGEMLRRVGLEGREKSYPSELSGGEAQRAAIARAFLYPHDLLLMDEPFSSLDLSLKKSLIALVTQLWEEKKNTVVFVTHDVHEAALLSHRAVVLRNGGICADIPVGLPFPRDFFARQPAEDALIRALTENPAENR